MTRVSLQPPETLCDQHLLAELREIKRIPNALLSGRLSPGAMTGAFVLGPGHVKFFTDKLFWLERRYAALHDECKYRRFNVGWLWPVGLAVSLPQLYNDWSPTTDDLELSMSRVCEKLPAKARWTRRKSCLKN